MTRTMTSRHWWTIPAATVFATPVWAQARIVDGWSSKLEYRYSEYGTQTIVPGITVQPSTHTIRLGLAYKFPVPTSSQ